MSLNLSVNKIRSLMKDKGVRCIEISKETNIPYSTIYTNLFGGYSSISVLLECYESIIKSKPTIAKNILNTDKTIENLLMNGFSYWEAIRIVKDE